MDASLARVCRPVGKARRGSAWCGWPGLAASAFEWATREEGAAHLASQSQTRTTPPPPRRPDPGGGRGLPVGGGRSQALQRVGEMGSR